jgi:ribosome maturation factor RimP
LSIEIETPSPGMRPGVTLDDCANFSRIVSAALDVEDPLDGAYELVVSSPGLDRPLRTPAHYQRYVGKRVRVKTYAPVPDAGNRKTFVGNLLGYDEAKGAVLIDVDGTHFAVPRQAISKANLDPVFDI